MSTLHETLVPQAREALASGRQAAAETWERIAAHGSELRDDAASAAGRLAYRTRDYVAEQPLRALGMALVAGAVAVALLGWFASDRQWRTRRTGSQTWK
jgi:ElaB/YqjD/DUF883 family membrane-anchored ribosome-binding protein